ncbi:peptidoglycan editing factor PgeF [Erythrobacter sp. MTPC3]|uniref:peptidoglycan editing factor PgeF n=1 Tax=Erythrobacter sp. MTPC3 TaxID=3056564 RepID=UPI0036F28810
MADEADFDVVRAAALGHVPHGFFGSGGGRHQFGYGGPGAPEHVRLRRRQAAHNIAADAELAAPHQVHSCDVVSVDRPWPDQPEGRPVADALVTANSGIALGIVTADCAPVLFADANAQVIGAAHAGWRGAHGGVLENTVFAMEQLGARRSDIGAAIGPTIAQESYEVDAEFRCNFNAEDEAHFNSAPPREGRERWHFDLPGYIRSRLERVGVGMISCTGLDTFSHSARYHSYRKSTQSGEPNYGRQISIIALG